MDAADKDKRLILLSWLENEFRAAVNDEAKLQQAAAMLKVGVQRGHHPLHVIRNVVAAFVIELIDPTIFDQTTPDAWVDRN